MGIVWKADRDGSSGIGKKPTLFRKILLKPEMIKDLESQIELFR